MLDPRVHDNAAACARDDTDLGKQDLARGSEEISSPQRIEQLAIVVKIWQARQFHIVDIHVGVQLVSRVDLKHVRFAGDALFQSPVAHVVEEREGSLTQARRGKIGRQRLPTGAEIMRVEKVRRVAYLVREARGTFRARMSLIDERVRSAHQIEKLLGIRHPINSPVFWILLGKRLRWLAVHMPEDWLWKRQRPVPAEMHVGLLCRD